MITIPIWLLTALVSFTATTIVCQAASIISNRRHQAYESFWHKRKES